MVDSSRLVVALLRFVPAVLAQQSVWGQYESRATRHYIILQNTDVRSQLLLLPLLLRRGRASRVSSVSQKRRVLTPPVTLLTLLTLVGG
jgi:hypothetical protein